MRHSEAVTGTHSTTGEGVGSWRDGHPTHRARLTLGLIALALALAVGGIRAVISLHGSFPGDTGIAARVTAQHLHGLALLPAHILNWLGRFPGDAIAIIVFCTWAWRAFGWRHAVLAFSTLGVSVLTWAIKTATDRTRPPGAALTSGSFPSGHTTWATAVFGLAALFLLQRGQRGLAVICIVAIVAMGPARVMLGLHWTSDVLAGYAVGLVWLIVLVLVGLPWAAADNLPVDRSEPDSAPPPATTEAEAQLNA